MANLLIVCGSLQARSANRAALDVARDHLVRLGGVAVQESVDLGRIPAFNPDEEADAGEAVLTFRAQLAAADVVLIAAPEYAGGLAGTVKNALEWIVGSAELYAKPVAIMSAGTSGGLHARRQLIQTLTWQGAHVVAQVGIGAPRTKMDTEGRYVEPGTIAAIERLAETLVDSPLLSADERLAVVRAITAEAGVEAGHIAPVV